MSLKRSSDRVVRAPIKTKQMRQFLIFTRTNCELVVRRVTKDTGVTFNGAADGYTVYLVRLLVELS
jgi:hypothetical protein